MVLSRLVGRQAAHVGRLRRRLAGQLSSSAKLMVVTSSGSCHPVRDRSEQRLVVRQVGKVLRASADGCQLTCSGSPAR
jgi:hypothetical protein